LYEAIINFLLIYLSRLVLFSKYAIFYSAKKNQTKQENMIKVFKVLLKRYNYENASDDPLF